MLKKLSFFQASVFEIKRQIWNA